MSRKQEIEETINRLHLELTKLNRYPDEDPYDDGDVVRFWKGLKSGGAYAGRYRRYTFAAIRIDGRWYRTGTSNAVDGIRHAMTWDELIEWLGSNASDLELLAPVAQPQPATTTDSSNDTNQPVTWPTMPTTWMTPSRVADAPNPGAAYAAELGASGILEDLEAIEDLLQHPDGLDALVRVLKFAVDATGTGRRSQALLVAVDRFLTKHGK